MPTVDILTLVQVRRVAVMIGIDPQAFSDGDPLPRGWHFALLAGETSRQDLRTDGFPGLGVTLPQLDRPRLLLGQRSMSFQGDLRIGAEITRHSAVASVVEKTGRNGPFSIVKVDHSLASGDLPEVTDTQTYVLLAGPTGEPAPKSGAAALVPQGQKKVVTPDEVMLFQYSALGFNTHRIHFDRDYAKGVEGHPDLVVNGGLASLLASEFLRVDLGRTVKSMSARHMAPLYVNRPITILLAEPAAPETKVLLLDSDGIVAAELGVTFDDL